MSDTTGTGDEPRRMRSGLLPTCLLISTVLTGCASMTQPEPPGIYVTSYEHEGAVGSGEVFVDFGSGQFGYPYSDSSLVVSGAYPHTGIGFQTPYYGLFGPRPFVSGYGIGYRAPVVVRHPAPSAARNPRVGTTASTPRSTAPRTPTVSRAGPSRPASRGSSAARRIEAASRSRSRSQQEHRRDTK